MRARHGHRRAAFLAALVCAGACARQLAFEPVAPSAPAQLDADVAALVAERTAEVRRVPHDARAHGTLGLVYQANELHDEARRCYERAAQLDTSGAAWQLRQAMAWRELGDIESAWRVLEAAAPRLAGSPAATQRLALARYERGDLDGAAAVLNAALAQSRTQPELLAALAQVENAREHWAAADACAREALALDPKFAYAHHQLGLALRGRFLAADAERELALGLGARIRWIPDAFEAEVAKFRVSYVAQSERASRLLAARKFQDALAIFEHLARSRGSDPILLTNLGTCQLDCGQAEQSVATLERAIALDPDAANARISASAAHLELGHAAEAVRHAERATALLPESLQAHVALAQARAAAGDATGSYAAWTRAAQCEPENTALHMPLADAAARAGKPDEARTWCLRALAADSANLEARVNLGTLALRRNDRVELARVLKELQMIAPNDERVLALQRSAQEAR